MMKFSWAISQVKWLSSEQTNVLKTIKTVHVPIKKNRQLLRTAKDDLGLKICGVYRIPCECGKVYIGQAGRSIEARCKEHMRHIRSINRRNLWLRNTA
jgi:hypothetical protein